jgi:hypothetical protein
MMMILVSLTQAQRPTGPTSLTVLTASYGAHLAASVHLYRDSHCGVHCTLKKSIRRAKTRFKAYAIQNES